MHLILFSFSLPAQTLSTCKKHQIASFLISYAYRFKTCCHFFWSYFSHGLTEHVHVVRLAKDLYTLLNHIYRKVKDFSSFDLFRFYLRTLLVKVFMLSVKYLNIVHEFDSGRVWKCHSRK